MYTIKVEVEQELDRLHNCGIIELVEFSELVAPIVPVMKGDRSIRICSDYKVTMNAVSKLECNCRVTVIRFLKRKIYA
jgi:hypothetical protein